MSRTSKTYAQAQKDCNEMNARLALVNSKSSNPIPSDYPIKLFNAVETSSPTDKAGITQSVWINGVRQPNATDQNFTTSNGLKVDTHNHPWSNIEMIKCLALRGNGTMAGEYFKSLVEKIEAQSCKCLAVDSGTNMIVVGKKCTDELFYMCEKLIEFEVVEKYQMTECDKKPRTGIESKFFVKLVINANFTIALKINSSIEFQELEELIDKFVSKYLKKINIEINIKKIIFL